MREIIKGLIKLISIHFLLFTIQLVNNFYPTILTKISEKYMNPLLSENGTVSLKSTHIACQVTFLHISHIKSKTIDIRKYNVTRRLHYKKKRKNECNFFQRLLIKSSFRSSQKIKRDLHLGLISFKTSRFNFPTVFCPQFCLKYPFTFIHLLYIYTYVT